MVYRFGALPSAHIAESLTYPGDHYLWCIEKFPPGEMNDLVASVAQQAIPLELGDRVTACHYT